MKIEFPPEPKEKLTKYLDERFAFRLRWAFVASRLQNKSSEDSAIWREIFVGYEKLNWKIYVEIFVSTKRISLKTRKSFLDEICFAVFSGKSFNIKVERAMSWVRVQRDFIEKLVSMLPKDFIELSQIFCSFDIRKLKSLTCDKSQMNEPNQWSKPFNIFCQHFSLPDVTDTRPNRKNSTTCLTKIDRFGVTSKHSRETAIAQLVEPLIHVLMLTEVSLSHLAFTYDIIYSWLSPRLVWRGLSLHVSSRDSFLEIGTIIRSTGSSRTFLCASRNS